MNGGRRRAIIAGVGIAVCLVIVVACLGFVRPGADGGWSVAWLFQTTEESVQAAGSSSAATTAEELATDAGTADASEADGAAAQQTDGASAQDTSSASSQQGNSSNQGAASGGNSPSSQGGASTSNPGAAGGAESSQTVTISVSIDSSQVGSPVSASGTYTFERGATAYDALCALGVSVNASTSQFGVYVMSIGGLAEKEHGGTSGWIYQVNGAQPATSASNYVLSDGDVVRWVYSVSE